MGFGLFYLVVFLYTGQLWLTILMHFLFDWLAFAADGTGGVTLLTGTPTTSSWVLTLVELVFFILLTVWMMHGKRRTVLERHAQRLMGSDPVSYTHLLIRRANDVFFFAITPPLRLSL